MLGDGLVIDPGAEAHRDPLLCRVSKVDLVDPDPIFRDDLQAGQRLVDHGLRDLVVPAKEGIKFTCELEHL